MARRLIGADRPGGRAAFLIALQLGAVGDIEVMMALALGASREDTEVLAALARGIRGHTEREEMARLFCESIGQPNLLEDSGR